MFTYLLWLPTEIGQNIALYGFPADMNSAISVISHTDNFPRKLSLSSSKRYLQTLVFRLDTCWNVWKKASATSQWTWLRICLILDDYPCVHVTVSSLLFRGSTLFSPRNCSVELLRTLALWCGVVSDALIVKPKWTAIKAGSEESNWPALYTMYYIRVL